MTDVPMSASVVCDAIDSAAILVIDVSSQMPWLPTEIAVALSIWNTQRPARNTHAT